MGCRKVNWLIFYIFVGDKMYTPTHTSLPLTAALTIWQAPGPDLSNRVGRTVNVILSCIRLLHHHAAIHVVEKALMQCIVTILKWGRIYVLYTYAIFSPVTGNDRHTFYSINSSFTISSAPSAFDIELEKEVWLR